MNSDFEQLCFESIQVDSSNFKPAVRDEAFAKIQLGLPHNNHPNHALKVKEDSVAQGNALPLFPGQVDDDGLPTTASQIKLHTMAHKYHSMECALHVLRVHSIYPILE